MDYRSGGWNYKLCPLVCFVEHSGVYFSEGDSGYQLHLWPYWGKHWNGHRRNSQSRLQGYSNVVANFYWFLIDGGHFTQNNFARCLIPLHSKKEGFRIEITPQKLGQYQSMILTLNLFHLWLMIHAFWLRLGVGFGRGVLVALFFPFFFASQAFAEKWNNVFLFCSFPFVAVSIGLTINKENVVGVIYNPILDEMFTAVKGGGAFCNDKTISCSKQEGWAHFCCCLLSVCL